MRIDGEVDLEALVQFDQPARGSLRVGIDLGLRQASSGLARLIATITPLIGWRGRFLFSRSRKASQLSLSAAGVGILRGVAAGGVDQHRIFGEPPVAIARAADAGDSGRVVAPLEPAGT